MQESVATQTIKAGSVLTQRDSFVAPEHPREPLVKVHHQMDFWELLSKMEGKKVVNGFGLIRRTSYVYIFRLSA